MKFIANADDFGLSPGINRGIEYAFEHGIVRSTTIMPGMNYYNDAIEIAKNNPKLRIGIHLTLTAGAPVLRNHKTIVDGSGNFIKIKQSQKQNIDFDEVRKELFAQSEKVFASKVNPTHLDSHHHVHMIDEVFQVMKEISKKYSIPMRVVDDEQKKQVSTTDAFSMKFYGEGATMENMFALLEQAKAQGAKSMELMCHPAFLDEIVLKSSAYNVQRANELTILTTPGLENILKTNGIYVSDFAQI